MLVMLPVNGYWYDYTGFPKEARADYYKKNRHNRQKSITHHCWIILIRSTPNTFLRYGVHIGRKDGQYNEDLYHFYQGHEKE